MDLTALFRLSYGLYVLGAHDGAKETGCIVNTCFQITNEPNTLAVSISKQNYTCDAILKNGRFSISVLCEGVDTAVIGRMGYSSGRDTDKFATIAHRTVDGLPVIEQGCAAYMICNVIGSADRGTHIVFFADIEQAENLEKCPPMTYDYYHRVIKGKAPKNAPTYQKEEPKVAQQNYVCTVCGYVHEGDIQNEPNDYVCPICGVSKGQFKPQ